MPDDFMGPIRDQLDRVFLRGLRESGELEGVRGRTRAQLVADVVGGFDPGHGAVIFAGGYGYLRVIGATEIDDLPGYVPYGGATPQHYGDPGDGAAHSGAAIVSAVTAGGYLPRGTYRVTSTVNLPAKMLRGDPAGGTVIVLDNLAGADGFNFAVSTGFGDVIGATDIEFVIKGSNCGAPLRTPRDANNYSTYYTRLQFERLSFRGENRNLSAHGFTWDHASLDGYISAGDCYGCVIRDIVGAGNFNIAADPAGQAVSKGIVLSAASALLSARLSNIEIGSVHTFMDVGDRVFYSIHSYDAIACYRGIYETGAVQYSEPKIGAGNINAQETGIRLRTSNARDIENVTLRRHRNGWSGATHKWVGISLGNSEASVRGCHFETDRSVTAWPGGSVAVVASGGGSLRFDSNTFGDGLTRCYEIDGVSGFSMVGDLLNAGSAMAYAYLSNNARRGTLVGARSTNSIEHTMLEGDGSIDWTTILDDVRGIQRLPKAKSVTIASGVITASQSFLLVDTEGGASTDDLDTITPPTVAAAAMILNLRAQSSDRTVVVKDNTGNIKLPADVSLTHSDDWLRLVYENNVWKQISFADNTA